MRRGMARETISWTGIPGHEGLRAANDMLATPRIEQPGAICNGPPGKRLPSKGCQRSDC